MTDAEQLLYANEFRRCLIELDVSGVRKIWQHVRSDMPHAGSDAEVLATLHMARTACETAPSKLRFYSHRWCLDRGYPSQCPFDIWSKAPPLIMKAVGIAVEVGLATTDSAANEQIKLAVRGAMENAVLEAYADGRQDDANHIRARMNEAKTRALRAG